MSYPWHFSYQFSVLGQAINNSMPEYSIQTELLVFFYTIHSRQYYIHVNISLEKLACFGDSYISDQWLNEKQHPSEIVQVYNY